MKNHKYLFLLHVPLILLGATMLLPLIFMINTALAQPGEEMRASGSFLDIILPSSLRWQNFADVWAMVPFMRFYLNSLGVAIAVTAGQVFTSALAAFAFSRIEWKWRDQVFLTYVATLMVPGAVTMIPNFVAMKMAPDLLSAILPYIDWNSIRHFGAETSDPVAGRLVGLDSYVALILPGFFSAYGTFLLRQFFMSLPKDLDEAAMIDGCNRWTIFSRIILPLSTPALATLTIFTFMGAWGSFLWPLVVLNKAELHTLPLSLQAFQGQYGTQWNLMMAASLMMLLPIVVIFLFGQRFFLSGLTVGAVKG